VDMNPSKFQNSRMRSTFKTNKHAYISPGALARGRGTSLKALASVRVKTEQRTPINQSKNFNPSTSYQNDPVQNNIPISPGFDPTEDDVPLSSKVEGVDTSDWEWLVKEHFLSEQFKETSTRNSINRFKLSMPHRMGSKPIRLIIYELGGKDGKPPNMDPIFFETRKKDKKLVEPEKNAEYVEIQKLVQSDSSLTNIDVVEKCFGPQRTVM
ncbi:hypothetical protein HAX54_023762, partial [Datura stramonium]|nr:hypothetical protein [Datura stramonium]